jgi:uncharacterized protein (DUF1800 family)
MNVDAFQASVRFGLGLRPGENQAIGNDPRGWLKAQLEHPEIPPEVAPFKDQSEAAKALVAFYTGKKQQKDMPKAGKGEDMAKGETKLRLVRQAFMHETALRLLAHQRSTQPYIERLVMFWSNHFTVSVQKPVVSGLAHNYEVEAIRPHVTGRFADMLKAVVRHPAMLTYLDNAQSIGPNSRAGQRRNKGLNENLAREILELHTLGVNGGYSQNDVIALAKILTGWGLSRKGDSFEPRFAFAPQTHEPGSKTLLGKTYAEDGEAEGVKALDDLANHPATARFIATKLVRHFVADTPPQAAIDKLASVFQATMGDLRAVSQALIDLPMVWATPLVKFKTPYEYVVSTFRLLSFEPDQKQALGALESLNYRVFNAASPAGYADTSTAWAGPDAVMKRIEWARALTRKLSNDIDPKALADMAFGPVMREETRFVIAGAETARDGVAFLLSSPEFQRR